MKVSELIDMLSELDPEAEICIVDQEEVTFDPKILDGSAFDLSQEYVITFGDLI